MTETQLKIKVLNYLKENHPQYWVYKTHDFSHSGIPDLLLCADKGHMVAIELKSGKDDYTKRKGWKIQKYMLDRINAAGGTAGVARSVDDVKKILDKVRVSA
jgi:hypothetical protein